MPAGCNELVKPHVARVVVCDPRKNALLKAGNKNDQLDARKLSELCARIFSQRCVTESPVYARCGNWAAAISP